jgi:alpha-amylase/alpha-mannosidase (GH57 family)
LAERFICIHGHFYQPPRENPWLEEVEFQESAQPYHDWNERVTAECYAPNAVSRVMDSEWRIIGLINNYSRINFNFGPTLLYWLDKHKPHVYDSILTADKESMTNFGGHGSAIAQVYNHMIMPLANRKDKETQVKWAIRDFEVRFGRFPEGMWLPETAVDTESLEVLAENNIKFTILSPHQASKTRKLGDADWVDVSGAKIDPRYPYQCHLPSGKTITLFFFDRRTANDISFGHLLENGEAFAKRLLDSLNAKDGEVMLESIASDGELYGHHHPHGDMTLAYCIYYVVSNETAKLTNYGEFLEKHPPQHEVQIAENTSWSCSHGVERWRSDCGDNMGRPGWHQAWRKPLREAMDWLRDSLIPRFETDAAQYLNDPWSSRNDYIDVVLNRSRESIDLFLSSHAKRPLSEEEKRRVVKLLEMQRHAMLMYTSCGWFFDEISGIETVQVMMYAARVMQLAEELFGLNLEDQYIKILEQAPSNIAEFENGAKVYNIFVKPAVVDFAKISAQNTIRELFADNIKTAPAPSKMSNCCFTVKMENVERRDDGRFRLILNRSTVSSATTLDEQTFSCAAIWLGDHNVTCGAQAGMPKKLFFSMSSKLTASFEKGQINEIIVDLSKYFGENYSLKDLFKDDQRYILEYIVEGGLKKAKELYDIVYHDNSALLRFMKENRIPTPKPLQSAAETVLNMEIEQLLSAETVDLEKLKKLINDSKHLAVTLDFQLLGFQASEKIADEFNKLAEEPENLETLNTITALIRMVRELPIQLDLWQSQNVAFKIAQNQYQTLKTKEDTASQAWVVAFAILCELIGIRLA